MSTLLVDLNGYDTDVSHRYYQSRSSRHLPTWNLHGNEEAKRAVKEFGITRQCDKVDVIALAVPDRVEKFSGNFLMHLLGPAARKLTPSTLAHKLVIRHRGQSYQAKDSLYGMAQSIRSFLQEEEYKIAKRAKAKTEKKPENRLFGEPVGLFVPDIGTKLRVVMPWTFALHCERRNEKMIQFVVEDPSYNYWRAWRENRHETWDVTVNPGSVLIVDRVYIRQGKGFEDFSSLTFRVEKGAEIVYNGKTMPIKRNMRFWAKLRHVNQLLVEVDLNSLPGQEKEGTARK